MFFFEKKNQKTFIRLEPAPSAAPAFPIESSAQSRHAGGMAASAFPIQFFIGRRGPFSAVAREVDDALRAAGHTTRVQDYDFPISGNFVRNIQGALRDCAHLIVVHSADYA
jgi:hypothetical protein